jgi:hypothetical protein
VTNTAANQVITGEVHRQLAKQLFNQAWELIELPDRTPEQDRLMLVTACSAWLHWDAIGTEEKRAVADWQVAHVASLLGYGDLALAHASAAFERTEAGDVPDWMRASALEGLARAHAAAGHQAERDGYLRRATDALSDIEEDEERELIASQIATVPAL